MNLRTGWNKEFWNGVCNNMVSIRERNGKFNVIYSYTNEKWLKDVLEESKGFLLFFIKMEDCKINVIFY